MTGKGLRTGASTGRAVVCSRSVKGWSVSVLAVAATVAVAVGGCGSAPSETANEPSGSFPVSVTSSFPPSQRLAQETSLIIRIRNTGARTLPNVAVTITNPSDGTAAQAFGMLLPEQAQGQPILASRSRPIWIVDQAPGPCGYSCENGGPGAGSTAYSNTWALGRLAPGQAVTFNWRVTAVRAGTYAIRYRVAAGLAPNARATISSRPRQASVNSKGQIVYSS